MNFTRTRRSALTAVLLAATLIGVSACGSSDPAPAAGGGTASGGAAGGDTVTVNALNIVSLAPLFVAQDKGFFADHGISNEYSTNDIYSTLSVQSQGSIDVNIPGLGGAFFNAVNQGLKMKAVADRNQYRCTSDSMLVSSTAAGITDAEGLRGKKVAILAKGSSTEYWLDLFLQSAGMSQADLGGVVNLTYPDTVNALKTGAVDAGFLTQPLAYQSIADGTAQRVKATYEIAPDEQQGLITMSQNFLDGSPDVATRWLAGWLEGVRYYQDPANKDDVVAIVAAHTSVPAETVAALYGTDQWPYMDPNGAVDTATAMSDDGQWLLDNKIVETLPEPSVWYDATPVTKAVELIGSAPAGNSCGDASATTGSSGASASASTTATSS
ncbi:ABC transporter substrate-binding protein [Nakamurella flavida]|uniref:ABC transporter substrate-binding protein n=1 Tax=Nakamurella flavida TaxID=363630 RepID=A0A939BZ41_9ACTN|nr:ABC transporter substrate-binding protein [Nakamurella flavida]MBM9475333.1 ABC transporter substrate-binding protein [Nakamurella flavida]MDP9776907.1 ABC-type nitrate/sulfonate/bicarbonate transport system substrate-binding protein [Nakamurella flavida]